MTLGNSSAVAEPLSAPLHVEFDYTRSVGPIVGRFLAGLAEHRVFGVRGADGRVLVPPAEYDPVTAAPLADLIEVGSTGTVTTWTWVHRPLPGQPFDRPFAWAMIRLDGADTALLHAVNATGPDEMATGMRVHIRWADEPTGTIGDIACFVPGEGPGTPESGSSTDLPEPISMLTTPVRLAYQHSASHQESWYLRGLAEGRLVGGRADAEGKVYIPPRGANPTDGRPTTEQVELPDRGTVTTYCVVNVPFLGQRIKPPYIAAYVLLDGADIAFLHLILECDPADVRMGMRVEAVWKPREEWGYTLQNIDHFRPSGEPDAEYDSYSRHL